MADLTDAAETLRTGLVCDLAEGHAPYRRATCSRTRPALCGRARSSWACRPRPTCTRLVAFLLSAYSQVPSITGYPVWLGDVDELLEP